MNRYSFLKILCLFGILFFGAAAERLAAQTNFSIHCVVIQPATTAGSNDATVRIEITQGNPPNQGLPPYNVYVTNALGSFQLKLQQVNCNPIFLTGLPAGNNRIYVYASTGQSDDEFVNIPVGGNAPPSICDYFQDPDCQAALIDLIKTGLEPAEAERCIQWEGDPCSSNGLIYRLGNVGIGTGNVPSGFSLAVQGGILTDNVLIELCEQYGWCDYVFEPKFKRPSLYEVDTYIRQNRHLPGVSSQQEILDQNGYELREAKLNQQEKIEEAYLYLIDLNHQMKSMEQKVAALREENELLKNKKK